MIRAAVIGLGGMGKGHFSIYKQLMAEGYPVELVAVCDIDETRFGEKTTDTNLDEFKKNNEFNFYDFHLYTSVDEMLEKENLDVVSVVAPTYEHFSLTCKCLKAGVHVLSEKPMATNLEHCRLMIETSEKTGKKLMIGQCLRFGEEYCYIKECIEKGTFGKVLGAYLYRGGGPVTRKWYRTRELGGGSAFDQHIHDVDMVNWLFGMPKAVQSVGVSAMEGSSYDWISTNYIYDDNIMVNTQNRWIDYGFGFEYGFRVTFEKASIIRDENGFRVFTEGEKDITPVIEYKGSFHYNEVKAFLDSIINDAPVPVENKPEASMDTIRLVLGEIESCDNNGAVVEL